MIVTIPKTTAVDSAWPRTAARSSRSWNSAALVVLERDLSRDVEDLVHRVPLDLLLERTAQLAGNRLAQRRHHQHHAQRGEVRSELSRIDVRAPGQEIEELPAHEELSGDTQRRHDRRCDDEDHLGPTRDPDQRQGKADRLQRVRPRRHPWLRRSSQEPTGRTDGDDHGSCQWARCDRHVPRSTTRMESRPGRPCAHTVRPRRYSNSKPPAASSAASSRSTNRWTKFGSR